MGSVCRGAVAVGRMKNNKYTVALRVPRGSLVEELGWGMVHTVDKKYYICFSAASRWKINAMKNT